MERIGRAAGTAQPAIRGTWLLEGYAYALALPAAAALLTERRAPDVRADNVALRLHEAGGPSAVAVLRPRFAALEEDTEGREDRGGDPRPRTTMEERRRRLEEAAA